MKISAIICTRNRAKYLSEAIDSLVQQSIPTADYEIVVVDNGSADNTNELVRARAQNIPNLRAVSETDPGLSHARNRGLKESIAPIAAFLDDDAIASRDWLAAILHSFATQPEAVCVGGPVEPWWEVPRPGWFPESFIGCHHRDYGPTGRWYNYPAEQPIGCNMALLRTRVLDLGGFNTVLQKYNDETELIARIVRSGGRLFYEPRANIRHLVSRERLDLGWQIRRHYEEGKSLAAAAALEQRAPRMQRIPEVGHNLFSITKRFARLFVSLGPIRDRVERLANLSSLVGQTVYLTKSLREQ